MRYASMFYGGVLVAATDADHDSYKRLDLLCPEGDGWGGERDRSFVMLRSYSPLSSITSTTKRELRLRTNDSHIIEGSLIVPRNCPILAGVLLLVRCVPVMTKNCLQLKTEDYRLDSLISLGVIR